MAEFFEGVGGVGDEFAEEDFLVGVEGVGHYVEELTCFTDGPREPPDEL